MPMLRENWADLLEPGIREWFNVGSSRRPSQIEQIFDVLDSQKSAEHFRGRGAISPDAWGQFSKTKKPAQVSSDAGFKSSFNHETFLVELPVEKELIEDNQYGEVMAMTEDLGDSAKLKREVDAASVFNLAFSGRLGPDGVTLCSDSHPSGPTNATTQDNSFDLALTAANLRIVREAMQAFTDDKGNLVAVTPNALIVPPGLEDTAIAATQSDKDPDSANNATNPQYGRYTIITWHYLTDSEAWFMVDTALMKQRLKWFDRVPLDITLDRADAAFAYYAARMRYSYGYMDWRWVAGSKPS